MKFSVEKKRDPAVVKAIESLYDSYCLFAQIIADKSIKPPLAIVKAHRDLRDLLRCCDVVMHNVAVSPIQIAPPVQTVADVVEEEKEDSGNSFLAGDFVKEVEETETVAVEETEKTSPAAPELAPVAPPKPAKKSK